MKNAYLQRVYDQVLARDPNEPEFHQTVHEFLSSLENLVDDHPEWEKNGILERFVEPDRIVSFRVSWVDDEGKVQINRGWRAQFNSAIGPYKGGIRFHPSVNQSVIKFLAFEMVLKNGLTTLPIGGGKGGSDFDPHGKSDGEIMRFCQAFITELYRYIGQFSDIPAGDIGVGAREIGYMFGQLKRINGQFQSAILTGKGLSYGGSLMRTEATGYGICYFTQEMLKKLCATEFTGKPVTVTGSGNVAIFCAEKVRQLGGLVVAMSDSNGYVYDPNGIKLDVIKDIKLNRRGRIKLYADEVPGATYTEGCRNIWDVPCKIALPCATQNEVGAEEAKKIIAGGCIALAEGANMPCTTEAVEMLHTAGIPVGPAKAANAGGVSTSALEMTQNSIRMSWSFEEVDERLHGIMRNIFQASYDASVAVGKPGNLVVGANVASFLKISQAMLEQGIY